ncbi:hypothetical protein DFJ73DRAFT_898493 [Zopfochytrium polystomum]|nr:hypothetical protein DFJ73DRAFT_898493 [Zopfochytrium polystomum]
MLKSLFDRGGYGANKEHAPTAEALASADAPPAATLASLAAPAASDSVHTAPAVPEVVVSPEEGEPVAAGAATHRLQTEAQPSPVAPHAAPLAPLASSSRAAEMPDLPVSMRDHKETEDTSKTHLPPSNRPTRPLHKSMQTTEQGAELPEVERPPQAALPVPSQEPPGPRSGLETPSKRPNPAKLRFLTIFAPAPARKARPARRAAGALGWVNCYWGPTHRDVQPPRLLPQQKELADLRQLVARSEEREASLRERERRLEERAAEAAAAGAGTLGLERPAEPTDPLQRREEGLDISQDMPSMVLMRGLQNSGELQGGSAAASRSRVLPTVSDLMDQLAEEKEKTEKLEAALAAVRFNIEQLTEESREKVLMGDVTVLRRQVVEKDAAITAVQGMVEAHQRSATEAWAAVRTAVDRAVEGSRQARAEGEQLVEQHAALVRAVADTFARAAAAGGGGRGEAAAAAAAAAEGKGSVFRGVGAVGPSASTGSVRSTGTGTEGGVGRRRGVGRWKMPHFLFSHHQHPHHTHHVQQQVPVGGALFEHETPQPQPQRAGGPRPSRVSIGLQGRVSHYDPTIDTAGGTASTDYDASSELEYFSFPSKQRGRPSYYDYRFGV